MIGADVAGMIDDHIELRTSDADLQWHFNDQWLQYHYLFRMILVDCCKITQVCSLLASE